MIESSPLEKTVCSRPSELTVPSISPARSPPCRRTRSPTTNGRALSSTTPAKRLPSVCWAARPRMTAVAAAAGTRFWLVTPATRSATSVATTAKNSRMRKPTVPAVPGSIRRNSAGPRTRPRSRARPKPSSSSATAAPSADRRVEAEQLLAEDVQHDRRAGEQQRGSKHLDPRALDRARAQLAGEARPLATRGSACRTSSAMSSHEASTLAPVLTRAAMHRRRRPVPRSRAGRCALHASPARLAAALLAYATRALATACARLRLGRRVASRRCAGPRPRRRRARPGRSAASGPRRGRAPSRMQAAPAARARPAARTRRGA